MWWCYHEDCDDDAWYSHLHHKSACCHFSENRNQDCELTKDELDTIEHFQCIYSSDQRSWLHTFDNEQDNDRLIAPLQLYAHMQGKYVIHL